MTAGCFVLAVADKNLVDSSEDEAESKDEERTPEPRPRKKKLKSALVPSPTRILSRPLPLSATWA